MPEVAPKRKVLNLAKEKLKKKDRLLKGVVRKYGMYPLNAPGMPGPGPNFLRHANELGDATIYQAPKKGKNAKDAVYEPGDRLTELYKRALREPGFILPVETRPGQFKEATFVPGHIWGEHIEEWQKSFDNLKCAAVPVTGPHPADVMVIGKMPWLEETAEGRNLINDTGEILKDMCEKLRITGLRNWYITNLSKYTPPDGGTTLKAGYIQDCLPLLHQELRIVKPKYILFLGADSSKALLGPKCTVSYMQGRVAEFTYPVHADPEHPAQNHTALCMTVLHPVNVARAQGPHEGRALERGLARFGLLISGADFMAEEEGLDHRVCTSLEDAEQWCQEVRCELNEVEPKLRILAVDAEWEGQHAVNKNAWIATIQISWAEKKSVCFHLRNEKGNKVFKDKNGRPAVVRLAKLLTKFVNKYRVCGHFFVSDLEMLCGEGFDFREGFAVPTTDDVEGNPPWKRCMDGEGGLDTGAMAHAVEETGMLGLEHLNMRYTTAPRYDLAVEDAVQELCKTLGIKRAALEGYGKIPRDILIKYANYDADCTRRICMTLLEYLDYDYDGNNCWEPFWETMGVLPIILEMHQNGIYVDRKRIDDLTLKFFTARSAKEEEVKMESGWNEVDNTFNIRSVQHVKEYLFGEHLNGKVDTSSKTVRIRPKKAKCLHVKPLLDTSKPPKRWEDIEAMGRTKEFSPGTGKAVLALLAQENPRKAEQINQIRDYRFLDQVLKSVLRPPKKDAETGEWLYEPDDGDLNSQGLLLYDAGLASCIDDDGMVRSHLYPTAETGRWKHARPNLANISKTRDPDYDRLLGRDQNDKPIYDHKLRSVLTAPPPTLAVPVVKMRNGKLVVEYEQSDWVLLESDLKGAELYGMAIMSGSKKMIEHAQRSIDNPDSGYDKEGKRCNCGEHGKPLPKCKTHKYPSQQYYDIHSNIAIMAFKLKCHPSKAGLEDVQKSHLRNIAKTVIFGLAYGRGAKAIAMAIKEQRKKGEPEVTVEDCQAVIDAVFEIYHELVPFFEEARSRALNEKWLCHGFGRFRRFPSVRDFKLAGEFERQAMNYSIQGMIASLVDRWLMVLHRARHELLEQFGEHIFQWQLQIHDALLVRCRPKYVEYIAKTLIPWSIQQVPVYPTHLDGSPIDGRGPYYLGAETEVGQRWGEKLSLEECARLGVPAEFGKAA